MAGEGSGKKVLEAEERLLAQAKPRFKVGKTIGPSIYEKTNGFSQGPNYSITAALATLSVWTRTMEAEAECKTSSFIDDSSVRTNEGLIKEQVAETAVKAIKTSE